MASTPAVAQSQDGRTARAERTRTAIADATLSLLEEGVLQPTAPQVAERAGVSLRSVFQHFADMEGLYASVADRQIARVTASVTPVPRDGALEDRITSFVAGRARLHEAVTPVRRAALLVEPFSEEIARRLSMTRRMGRREVEKVFALEIGMEKAADRRDLLEAVTAASSWSAWETLRAQQKLSVPQATRIMARTIEALLRPPHGAEGQ